MYPAREHFVYVKFVAIFFITCDFLDFVVVFVFVCVCFTECAHMRALIGHRHARASTQAQAHIHSH